MNDVELCFFVVRVYGENVGGRNLKRVDQGGDIDWHADGQRLTWFNMRGDGLAVGVEEGAGLVVQAALAEVSKIEVPSQEVVGRYRVLLDLFRLCKQMMTCQMRN